MKVTTVSLFALIAVAAAAQEPPAITGERDRSKPIDADSQWANRTVLPPAPPPLSVGEKYRYNFIRIFDANAMGRTAFTSFVDVAVDDPEEWPAGVEGYAIRFASKTGRRTAKRMLAATVQSALGHDPRRIRTTSKTFWGRTGQAVLNTYRSRKDSGGVSFNYSRVVGAYGAGFISRSWHPASDRTVEDALMNGTITMAMDGGTAILWEFWPDIKKKFFRRR